MSEPARVSLRALSIVQLRNLLRSARASGRQDAVDDIVRALAAQGIFTPPADAVADVRPTPVIARPPQARRAMAIWPWVGGAVAAGLAVVLVVSPSSVGLDRRAPTPTPAQVAPRAAVALVRPAPPLATSPSAPSRSSDPAPSPDQALKPESGPAPAQALASAAPTPHRIGRSPPRGSRPQAAQRDADRTLPARVDYAAAQADRPSEPRDEETVLAASGSDDLVGGCGGRTASERLLCADARRLALAQPSGANLNNALVGAIPRRPGRSPSGPVRAPPRSD